MSNEAVNGRDYSEVVAQDRATMIREAAKQLMTKDPRAAAVGKVVGDEVIDKAAKKVLDKGLVQVNNYIWGMTFTFLPLLGLTALASSLVVMVLLFKGPIAEFLSSKGINVEVSLWTVIYTWATFISQIFLTVVAYILIYLIIMLVCPACLFGQIISSVL